MINSKSKRSNGGGVGLGLTSEAKGLKLVGLAGARGVEPAGEHGAADGRLAALDAAHVRLLAADQFAERCLTDLAAEAPKMGTEHERLRIDTIDNNLIDVGARRKPGRYVLHMTKADLGQALRTLRAAAKLTQADLAEKIGYAQSSVSSAEIGAAWVPIDVIEQWAAACGTGVQLVFGKGEQTPDTARLVAAWQLLNEEERETYLDIIEARAKRSKEKG